VDEKREEVSDEIDHRTSRERTTMISLFDFPRRDVFTRWEESVPAEAATDRDPRGRYPCKGDGCQTFEWRGYAGLCGWCQEQR